MSDKNRICINQFLENQTQVYILLEFSYLQLILNNTYVYNIIYNLYIFFSLLSIITM